MTRKQKVIWAAGFFDGEGCISIAKSVSSHTGLGTNYRVRIKVAQQVRKPLEIFKELWGGSFTVDRRSHVHVIQIAGNDAKRMLLEIQPYSVRKTKQIDVALSVIYGGSGKRYTKEQRAEFEKHYTKMRKLNQRGPKSIQRSVT
jgi:LAGLIDADG endonuclease